MKYGALVCLLLFAGAQLSAQSSRSEKPIIDVDDDEIQPSNFPLDEARDYVFHFKQAETKQQTLFFVVLPDVDRKQLEHFTPIVEITLFDETGYPICQVGGNSKSKSDAWVLGTDRLSDPAFSHPACSNVVMWRQKNYMLIVKVRRERDDEEPEIRVALSFQRSDSPKPAESHFETSEIPQSNYPAYRLAVASAPFGPPGLVFVGLQKIAASTLHLLSRLGERRP